MKYLARALALALTCTVAYNTSAMQIKRVIHTHRLSKKSVAALAIIPAIIAILGYFGAKSIKNSVVNKKNNIINPVKKTLLESIPTWITTYILKWHSKNNANPNSTVTTSNNQSSSSQVSTTTTTSTWKDAGRAANKTTTKYLKKYTSKVEHLLASPTQSGASNKGKNKIIKIETSDISLPNVNLNQSLNNVSLTTPTPNQNISSSYTPLQKTNTAIIPTSGIQITPNNGSNNATSAVANVGLVSELKKASKLTGKLGKQQVAQIYKKLTEHQIPTLGTKLLTPSKSLKPRSKEWKEFDTALNKSLTPYKATASNALQIASVSAGVLLYSPKIGGLILIGAGAWPTIKKLYNEVTELEKVIRNEVIDYEKVALEVTGLIKSAKKPFVMIIDKLPTKAQLKNIPSKAKNLGVSLIKDTKDQLQIVATATQDNPAGYSDTIQALAIGTALLSIVSPETALITTIVAANKSTVQKLLGKLSEWNGRLKLKRRSRLNKKLRRNIG